MRMMLLPLAPAVLAVLFGGVGLAAEDRLGDPLPDRALQRLGTLRMRYTRGISDLCYLPDGRGLIALGKDVEVWDLAEGKVQSRRRVCDATIRSIVPRSDGRAILVTDRSGAVCEWDLIDEARAFGWDADQPGLRCAHYSPDETRLLTTGHKPPTLKEWDVATGDELASIAGAMHYFHEGIYGPDGATVIVDGGNGAGPCLARYALSDGELRHEWLKDYYTHGRSMVLSEDRTRLLIGSRHSATEWLLDGYEQLGKFSGHHGHAVTAAAYCKDPGQLLTGSRDGSIRRWDRIEAKVLLRWCPHNGHVTRIQVSPDGEWVLSYGSGVVAETSMATGEPRVAFERHNGPVRAVGASPSGDVVVSGSTDATLRAWNTSTGECLVTMTDAGLGAYCVAVSPDGERVAVGCKDGVVREYGLAEGGLIRELKGHRGYVRSVAYAPTGGLLLSSGGDGGVWVWAPENDAPIRVLQGHRGGVLSVAVSADGHHALSGGRDGTVKHWQIEEGVLLRTLEGHRGWVHAVAFAGDGHALSGARDGRVIKWDLATGETLSEMIHGSWVYALACAPKTGVVYAAGNNDLITSWDLATGERTATLKGHEGDIFALALSADGTRLISACQDTTLLVWDAAG